MKKFLLILSMALVAISATAQGLFSNSYPTYTQSSKRPAGKDNIIAVVEDRVITRNEVMTEVQRFIPQIRSQSTSEFDFNRRVNAYINEIVQNMVDRELIVKDFYAKGMSIPKSYLDTYFDDYLKREFNGERAEFIRFVQSQGKTIKQFRAEQEKEIIVGYMQNQKRQSAAEISPKKVIDYYNANMGKWFSPPSIRVRMITLKTGINATLQSNKKLAEEICNRLKSGEKFEDLARKYSKDDSSAKGGDWGWYKKGELNPVLDKKAFELSLGGVTEPVEIGDMVFILKLEEKKDGGTRSIDDVRQEIEFAIIEENSKVTYRKWIEGLRSKAFVKYFQ